MKLNRDGWRRVFLPALCVGLAGMISQGMAQSRPNTGWSASRDIQLQIVDEAATQSDSRDQNGRQHSRYKPINGGSPIRGQDELEDGNDAAGRNVLVHMAPGQFRGAAKRENVKTAVQQFGGLVKYEYDVVLPNVMALRNLTDADVARIRAMPGVIAVEEDEYHPDVIKLDEATPLIGALQSQLVAAGLPFDGTGIRVCVLDTGIDGDHTMYAARIDVAAGRDFVNNDSNPEDDNGHGAHVAGIAVGRTGIDINFGCEGLEPFQGIAPGATLIGVKVLNSIGGGTTSNIIAGIDYCANQTPTGGRAHVINLSLGTGDFSGSCTHSWAVAANNAVANGVVVVAAAGNENRSNSMLSPACGAGVIAVGATYKDNYPNCENGTNDFEWSTCDDFRPPRDRIVCFSNKSDELDVTAPGALIWSANRVAGGVGITSKAGTSMAAPMVAGLAALILHVNPDLTPAEVRQIIRDGAVDLGTPGFDRTYGYGRIDVTNSLILAGGTISCVTHADCADGVFCNGEEQCVGEICRPGTPPDCDDGVPCTSDSCNEAAGMCDNIPDDSFCSDGLFCNGTEWCHLSLGCQTATPPNCNDGIPCTTDSCSNALGACVNAANDSFCDDGLFCNGAEWCDEAFGCRAGVPPTCDDGVACTADSCDPAANACANVADDSLCLDSQYCNGEEWCHATLGCQAGGNPCPGQLCNEATHECETVACVVDGDCDDGLFCTGHQVCSGGSCVPGPSGGVTNGTIDGSASWTQTTSSGGSVTYSGSLRIVGPDNRARGFAWAAQSGVALNGAQLEFYLNSYASQDVGAWDYPVFYLNGTFRGLNRNGTLGGITTGTTSGSGNINNGSPVASPIRFVVNMDALAGHSGPHTIGFGVASADGAYGPGTAVFDDVGPPPMPAGEICPGQFCDESARACAECLTDAHCDDGLFCNGLESCIAGSCMATQVGGVVNGTFDGGAFWIDTPAGGTITYPGNLRVVGPNAGVRTIAWAGQTGVVIQGANLEFDLLSYSSQDTGTYDYPVFYLNGTFRGLNRVGTLGPVTTGATNGSGTISNASQIGSPIHFVVDINALAGHSGPHTIGFGVATADGRFGAGTAVFDNMGPSAGTGGPCPGQSCDEVNDVCVP